MRHKIPCFCDNTFTVDVPEQVDLDTDPQYIEDILAGNFMNYTCASCGKRHKPEFPLTVTWSSKNTVLEVLPELSRGEFYRRKEDKTPNKETVISYPEMTERIAVIKDGLTPEAVEALKYYLFMKADETYPEEEIGVWYHSKTENALEFHIHGIKNNEVAIMKLPLGIYEKTLGDYRANPKAEPFAALRVKTYCSIQNILRPDELK
jgi:hypothetical protein